MSYVSPLCSWYNLSVARSCQWAALSECTQLPLPGCTAMVGNGKDAGEKVCASISSFPPVGLIAMITEHLGRKGLFFSSPFMCILLSGGPQKDDGQVAASAECFVWYWWAVECWNFLHCLSASDSASSLYMRQSPWPDHCFCPFGLLSGVFTWILHFYHMCRGHHKHYKHPTVMTSVSDLFTILSPQFAQVHPPSDDSRQGNLKYVCVLSSKSFVQL